MLESLSSSPVRMDWLASCSISNCPSIVVIGSMVGCTPGLMARATIGFTTPT